MCVCGGGGGRGAGLLTRCPGLGGPKHAAQDLAAGCQSSYATVMCCFATGWMQQWVFGVKACMAMLLPCCCCFVPGVRLPLDDRPSGLGVGVELHDECV